MKARVTFINAATDFTGNGPGGSVETWEGGLETWTDDQLWISHPTERGRRVIGASGMGIRKDRVLEIVPL